MKRTNNQSGLGTIEAILVIVIFVAVIGMFWYVITSRNKSNNSYNNAANNSTVTSSNIVTYNGRQFPVLPSSFILIAKVPEANGNSRNPAMEYLVKNTKSESESISQVTSQLQTICKDDNLSGAAGVGTVSMNWSSGGKNYGYTGNGFECHSDKLAWSIDIANAAVLAYPGFTSHLSNFTYPPAYKNSLSSYSWVEISSAQMTPGLSPGLQPGSSN